MPIQLPTRPSLSDAEQQWVTCLSQELYGLDAKAIRTALAAKGHPERVIAAVIAAIIRAPRFR